MVGDAGFKEPGLAFGAAAHSSRLTCVQAGVTRANQRARVGNLESCPTLYLDGFAGNRWESSQLSAHRRPGLCEFETPNLPGHLARWLILARKLLRRRLHARVICSQQCTQAFGATVLWIDRQCMLRRLACDQYSHSNLVFTLYGPISRNNSLIHLSPRLTALFGAARASGLMEASPLTRQPPPEAFTPKIVELYSSLFKVGPSPPPLPHLASDASSRDLMACRGKRSRYTRSVAATGGASADPGRHLRTMKMETSQTASGPSSSSCDPTARPCEGCSTTCPRPMRCCSRAGPGASSAEPSRPSRRAKASRRCMPWMYASLGDEPRWQACPADGHDPRP